jgi:outer membrane autotransporter protein
LQPQLEFSWLHEFNDDLYFVRGQFVEGAPVVDNFFVLPMDPVDTDYFRLGVGVMARFNRGPSAWLQYRTFLGYDNLQEQGIMAQLRWEF